MTYQLLQSLTEADQSLLLYLNGLHNTFGDYFMPVFTGKWIWVPMYAGILYVLLKNYNWKVTLLCLIAITLTITFADQVCATLIRPIVERPRPSNPASPIADLVHIVNGRRGGGFGFPSCHASNSFGLAFFLVFLFRKRWLSLFICIWATVNCYTRIYLGLHYPKEQWKLIEYPLKDMVTELEKSVKSNKSVVKKVSKKTEKKEKATEKVIAVKDGEQDAHNSKKEERAENVKAN